MTLIQVQLEIRKIENTIEALILRSKELSAERALYYEKFENGEISQTLYSMRMTPIYFEHNLIKKQYDLEAKKLKDINTKYLILKCFDNDEF